MKIKSLILSSVAAAGLTTGAMAADLGTVLTSLDVCDSLGISGLTISSDSNCLAISGGVKYSFKWGDYDGTWAGNVPGVFKNPDNFGVAPFTQDWASKVDAWLKFVGTADSSFGPASATIKLGYKDYYTVRNERPAIAGASNGLSVKEAYVSVGDSTVLMAGLKSTIANFDDDKSLTWKKLFNDEVGKGTYTGVGGVGGVALPATGGHVIQVTSDLGNGVSVGGALEKLNTGGPNAGTAVGVLAYAGNGITAHATILADGILTGTIATWGLHAGMTGEFDMFKIGAALAANSAGDWDVQGTASATFDIFTLAAAAQTGYNATSTLSDLGVAVSGSAEVTTGVTINAGFRWFDTDTATASANTEGWQAAAGITAAVTETITLEGEIGVYGNPTGSQTNAYGTASVAWAPGGGFKSSLAGTAWQDGAYSLTFKASKDFE